MKNHVDMHRVNLADGRTMYYSQVSSRNDIEVLRMIRNVCRQGFSYDTEIIGARQQRRWWNSPTRKLAFLYWIATSAYGREVVGYGLLRDDLDGRPCSSVAVLPDSGGQGYGGFITAHLIRKSPETVYASARKDNPAAQALHRAEDWDTVGEDDTLIYYKTKDDIWERPQRELAIVSGE